MVLVPQLEHFKGSTDTEASASTNPPKVPDQFHDSKPSDGTRNGSFWVNWASNRSEETREGQEKVPDQDTNRARTSELGRQEPNTDPEKGTKQTPEPEEEEHKESINVTTNLTPRCSWSNNLAFNLKSLSPLTDKLVKISL